jgi:hypothetical protein
MSISPAIFTSRAIIFAASAISYRMLLNAPVASGYLRSCSTMWRSMVMTALGMGFSSTSQDWVSAARASTS